MVGNEIDRDWDFIAMLMKISLFMTALIACLSLSGCGVMGVRKVDFWGAKMEFAEGLDFHAGANSIDKVDDRRGVSRLPQSTQNELPGKGY